jgi:N-acetyl-alpha-D-muramate 1-phosphate uridylyltransferase
MIPEKAFILAAGLGTRMQPLTNDRPKPLVEIAGRTLLERTLDQLEEVGVNEVVINTHYLAGRITSQLMERVSPRIHFSHEPVLLNTGGGIKNALQYFGNKPFYVLSGDGLWTDGPSGNALKCMAKAWEPEVMDILMLLQPIETFNLTKGVGDYDFLPGGEVERSIGQHGKYMFTSMRINDPSIFNDTPDTAFSYLDLMDKAQTAARLHGLVHDGEWHHLSTPEDVTAVDAALRGKKP